MAKLPLGARLYWLLVVAAGLGVLGLGLADAAERLSDQSAGALRWCSVLVLMAGTLAQTYRVWLPNPNRTLADALHARRGDESERSAGRPGSGERETTSVSSAVYTFAYLALPTSVAVLLSALSLILASPTSPGRRWYQHVFNLAQYSLAIGAAGTVWSLGQQASAGVDPVLLWLGPALASYWLVNTGTVAGMVARAEALPTSYVWLRGRRRLVPSYLLVMVGGALVWLLWRERSLFPTGLVLLFGLAAVYQAVRYRTLLQQQTIDALSNLADLLDRRDQYTHNHSLRVGRVAERLALRLGLPRQEAAIVFLCGRLHDIGKCAVSNDVLLKPGPLNEAERDEMARHATIGAEMLAHFPEFEQATAYVRGHHERYDGEGYPDRLARGQIPLGARIIAVADAFDAMTSDRPYRAALPLEEAVRRLRAGAGSQWDPRVVVALLGLLGVEQPVEPIVRLVARPPVQSPGASLARS